MSAPSGSGKKSNSRSNSKTRAPTTSNSNTTSATSTTPAIQSGPNRPQSGATQTNTNTTSQPPRSSNQTKATTATNKITDGDGGGASQGEWVELKKDDLEDPYKIKKGGEDKRSSSRNRNQNTGSKSDPPKEPVTAWGGQTTKAHSDGKSVNVYRTNSTGSNKSGKGGKFKGEQVPLSTVFSDTPNSQASSKLERTSSKSSGGIVTSYKALEADALRAIRAAQAIWPPGDDNNNNNNNRSRPIFDPGRLVPQQKTEERRQYIIARDKLVSVIAERQRMPEATAETFNKDKGGGRHAWWIANRLQPILDELESLAEGNSTQLTRDTLARLAHWLEPEEEKKPGRK